MVATPFPVQDSAMLRRLAHADALILRAAARAGAAGGRRGAASSGSIRSACEAVQGRKSCWDGFSSKYPHLLDEWCEPT